MIMLFLTFVKAFFLNQYAKWYGYDPIAPAHVITGRGRMCEGCDFAKEGVCGKCGCLIMAKVMLATEKCPVGKWKRVWLPKQRREETI